MVRCCTFLKVRHIESRKEREFAVRFFTVATLLGFLAIHVLLLITTIVVRTQLGITSACPDVPESLYTSVYLLLAVCGLVFVFLMGAIPRALRIRRSHEVRGFTVAAMVIITSKFLVAILAVVHSSASSEDLKNKADNLVNNNVCMNELQNIYKCCGFHNFTEWTNRDVNTSSMSVFNLDGFLVNIFHESNNSNCQPYSVINNHVNTFPESCLCKGNNCRQVLYSSQLSADANQTVPRTNESSATGIHCVNIHPEPCGDHVSHQLTQLYLATATSATTSAILELVVFLFSVFLVRRLEGSTAIADVYRQRGAAESKT